MEPPVDRKDALWCAGLLLAAASIFVLWGLIVTPLANSVPLWLFQGTAILLQVCMFLAIGAGIGALFKRRIIGAAIAGTLILLFILLTSLPGR